MIFSMQFYPGDHYFLPASTKYRVQMCTEVRKIKPVGVNT